MSRALMIAALLWVSLSVSAHAENSACWGDNSRADISCTQITEGLLLSFRGKSMEFVRNAMKADGRSTDIGLRFLSNYSRGQKTESGSVNVSFDDGRATIVSASIDGPNSTNRYEFVWNAYAVPTSLGGDFDPLTKDFKRKPFCSDMSAGPFKCSAGRDSVEHGLLAFQMQFGATKAQLLKVLDAACNLNASMGLPPNDPSDDCVRLRERLR